MLATGTTVDDIAECLWHLAPSSTTVSAAAYIKKHEWLIERLSVLISSASVRRSACAGYSVHAKPHFHERSPTLHGLAIFRIAKIPPGDNDVSNRR
jgi:hypothetical protein